MEAAHAEHHPRLEFDGTAAASILVKEFQRLIPHDLKLPKGHFTNHTINLFDKPAPS